jgi:hypothetical protein
LTQPFRHRADFAVADDPIVDLNDTGEFAHGASAKDFVGAVNIDWRQVRFDAPDFLGGANLDDGGAGDSFRAGEDAAGGHIAFAHDEDMSRVGFGNEAAGIEHEGIVGAGIVRFDLGQN